MSASFQFLVPPDANDRLCNAPVPAAARASKLHGLVPYMVTWVDTRKVMATWHRQDPILHEQRDDAQLEEIFQAMTRTGNEYMPILFFTEDGRLQFVDGRHRMHVFCECEYDEVPVVVPAAQAGQFESLFGITESITP